MNEDLTDAERAALDELVFELSGPHTPATIAARLGLSSSYVRELERRALAKLRRAAIAAGHEGQK